MGLTKQECYLLVCDGCGHDFEYDFVPHFDTPGAAADHVVDTGGVAHGGRHWCEECTVGGKVPAEVVADA